MTDSKPTVTATRPRFSPARGRGWTFIRRRRGEQRQVGHQYPTCKLKQQGSLKPKIRFSGCLWRLVLRQSVFVSQNRANRFSDGLKLPKIKRLRSLWRCSTPICKTAGRPCTAITQRCGIKSPRLPKPCRWCFCTARGSQCARGRPRLTVVRAGTIFSYAKITPFS